jgi:DNA-binding protein HU-beta
MTERERTRLQSMPKEDMPMAMTKSEISRRLADKVGISKKQSDAYLEALAQLAYEEAKNTFTIPGLGKLVLVEKPAREATMPFGPRKGERYTIPAKKAVKFRLSKAAKDAIVGQEPASMSKGGNSGGGESTGMQAQPTSTDWS